jgi:arsenate reductase
MTAHWGVPGPAAAIGSVEEQRRVFRDAFWVLTQRISLSSCLPFDKLQGLALQQEQLDRIGHE